MTDRPLVDKRLAVIDTCVADLRRLARVDQLETDVRERRFVEHTLQIAIQAALDVASHIVSDRRLGEPATNRELFLHLGDLGRFAASITRTLEDEKAQAAATEPPRNV